MFEILTTARELELYKERAELYQDRTEARNFTGKTVLVTGGSRGIGAEICREFAKWGASRIIIICTPGGLDRANIFSEELEGVGVEVFRFGIDLAQEDSADRIIQNLNVRGIDKIDVLVNNAGISNEEIGKEYTPEDETLLQNTNWRAPFNLTKALARSHLQEDAVIINMSSTFALYPDPNGAVNVKYSETKRKLIQMTTMREELGLKDGVRINAIAPGFVQGDNMAAKVPKAIIDRAAKETPGGELISEKTVAEVVCLMASPAFDVTGKRIVVDHGLGPQTEIIVGEEIKNKLDQAKRIEEAKARRAARLGHS